ncbi:hypothetical protein OIV83_004418 [Microbotryomycetes sp. JL201]|nr:hypothetical protein OIV83_004418 [Microbotryomycetes sp. JL201]
MAAPSMLRSVARQALPRPTCTPRRNLTASAARRSAQRTSLEHPRYHGLYYHPIDPQASSSSGNPAYALSFLSDPPPAQASLNSLPSVIGILQQRAPSTRTSGETSGSNAVPDLVPRNFTENRDFRTVLHDILRQAVTFDAKLHTEAQNRQDGWIHIADARAPADLNRVPDPSDIIASVLVQEGRIVPESYEPGGMHRMVTNDGLMKLDEGLMPIVRQALEQVRQIELQELNNHELQG